MYTANNLAVIRGELLRPVERRTTADGADVASFDLRVRYENSPSEAVPVAWIDLPDKLPELLPDDEIVVIGRVRRRFFRSGGTTQSRTEVVATAVVPARQRKRVDRLLLDASAELIAS